MGRTSGDTDGDAPPAVTVTLSSFMIGKHEVSRTLWNDVRAWASANGYTDLATGGSRALSHPVYSISWFDAVKWCNARSEREGLTPCYTIGGAVMRTGTLVPAVNWNANGYRLPTEAEWEKAARGGVAGKRFPWGTDTISHTEANFQNNGGEAYAVGTTGYHATHGIGTAPCGSFAANDYGLHDMAGNVWEWCWDWWGSNYVNGAFDPRGPASGDYRVFRGGSWFNNAKSARSANRGVNFPTVVSTTFGFRVARSAIPSVIPPEITGHPSAATINSGSTTTLTVAASGSAPLAYQWYQGAAGITDTPVGTDSSSFTTPALSMDTSYWVRVSNSSGSADSAAAMVTVIVPPSIISHPDSREIWDYESATLYVTASGSQPLSYQWYAGSPGDTSQPVGTGDAFSTSFGGTYWVRVSNAAGSADSGAASVTVRFLPPDPPLIISQPASATIPSDSSVTLTVAANGTAPLSYQWYQGPVGTMTMPVGSDSNRFTTPALTQTTSYWVRVSNSAGSVDSEPATVAVISSAPLIITQPVSTTALTGSTATLSVNARGSSPLAYQWYQGAAGVTTTPVGINSASFTTPALTTTTGYWVRVSNSFGSVDSAAATIKVQASAREVAIPDPILLAELRKALAKPTGAITDLDLLTLTTLRINGLGITDLTGLEYATNLRILDIRRNNFADAAALWVVLDQITPMYCLYVDVRRPGQTPYGIVAQQLTDTSGNSFFILVDAPNLPSLDFNSLSVDTSNQSNISALQTINEAGVAVETGGVNLPPSAYASATVVDHAARSVQLSAAYSADIDGTITRYAWSWAGGSANGFSPGVTLPYGDTLVTLTVTDDDGATGSYSLMVTLLRPYSTPAVANLTASQRAGTRLVDIRYDVSAFTPAVTSRLRISSDGGTTFNVPATTLSGAIRGPFSTGAGKAIVWDAGADWPQQFSQTMRFEVTADDGIGTPDGMSLIPAGRFTMGRTSGDTDSNAPPVDVNVSAFYMGKNEVTKALWDEVRTWAVANGYTDLAAGAGKAANHPVQSVSWWDVVKWCNARSEKEGLTPCYTVGAAVMKTGTTVPTVNWSANGYRLPTEAEWEKAARGGVSGKRFPWGTDTISHSLANYLASSSLIYDSSGSVNNHHPAYNDGTSIYTAPVGSFLANGYGLFDMAGNVWEWCWDWYGASAYANGASDPRGAASGTNRVIRGGSWGWNASHGRAGSRSDSSPTNRGFTTGFRVARSPLADVVPPTITSQPASTSVVGNTGATLAVAAAGTAPFSYQWYQGAVGVTTNPVGSNAAAFSAPAPAATTRYWVRVSNAAGSVDSIAATVDVMSLVPSGNFTMGRSSGDADGNAPPVTVNTYAFQIGKFEVSKALWDEVRAWAFTNGYTDLPEAGGKTPEHPAHGINWFDALKWCNARSEKEGLTPVYIDNRAVMKTGTSIPTVNWSADGYRLPSEAEWEKAARGGRSDRRFPWGDTISHSQANYLSSSSISYDVSPTRGQHPSYAVSPSPFTSPIGSFAANDYGLHDTSGNVREWCWDWYDAAYYANNASDPRGPATGTNRVIRGGGSDGGAEDARSMHRGDQDPNAANQGDGLRVVGDGFRVARGPLVSLTAPAIITQPASSTIASGTTTTLRVTAAGRAPLTYQWYQGAVGTTTTPVGTNSPNFTTPALTATTSYWVRISNPDGILNSAAVTVTIPVAPGITTQPASTTINSGETATLTVTATGTAPLTYQWYQGAVGTTTTPVGTNSATFTTPTLTATTTYWVRVSNAAGNVNSTLATVTVGSSTPADLALIPAGAFQMGRTSGDTDSNAPSVSVTVSAFYMGRNEVTKALWDEVRTWAVANGYTDLAAGDGKAANHPVQTVSWWDVIKWCNARSQKEGLTPCYTVSGAVMKTGTTAPTVNWSANGYRLPTEAEWEKAARGGVSGKRFPWGTDTISHSQANFWNGGSEAYKTGTTGYHPTYATGSFPYTSPVGSFAANAYGLHDMAGNVWEWCWDWYGGSTYVNGATDPRGAASGTNRVRRGGSWDNVAFDCRAAFRGFNAPSGQRLSIGFRIARSSVP